MFSIPAVKYAMIALVVAGAIALTLRTTYQQGYTSCEAEYATKDLKDFEAIMERISNAEVDTSDPATVDCLLRELAGLSAEGDNDQCSDLLGD